MNKTYLLAVAAALVAAPMAFAHSDGGVYGTPKAYCEDIFGPQETIVHDYWDGSSHAATGSLDGSIPPCPYDPQWDGHYEWAVGGAWLLACEGNGIANGGGCDNPYGKQGDGSLICWGTYADHSVRPEIWVFEHSLSTAGLDVGFRVGADFLDNFPNIDPAEPNCGDWLVDYSVSCVNHCRVDFPPGKDGSYMVFVAGPVGGHVWST